MSAPFVGEIRIFAGNFPPRNWAFCNGQLLAISQNTALFSLLGTTYGGNGTSNFALPNLQGCAPMHAGQGPGLTDRVLGELSGSPTVTLLTTEVPQHSHTYTAGSGSRGNVAAITGNVNSDAAFQTNIYGPTADSTLMSPTMLTPLPASQPHENMQPYLALNFIIALAGIFPARN
jgi:microcystin-dependent protein